MKRLILLLCLAFLSLGLLNGRQSDSGPWYKTPEELIQDIYIAVSAKNSESVDWQRVRSMFMDEAVVILRTSRDKLTQFTVDGFIQDFKDFYLSPSLLLSPSLAFRSFSEDGRLNTTCNWLPTK